MPIRYNFLELPSSRGGGTHVMFAWPNKTYPFVKAIYEFPRQPKPTPLQDMTKDMLYIVKPKVRWPFIQGNYKPTPSPDMTKVILYILHSNITLKVS